jgi:hypothetical protein
MLVYIPAPWIMGYTTYEWNMSDYSILSLMISDEHCCFKRASQHSMLKAHISCVQNMSSILIHIWDFQVTIIFGYFWDVLKHVRTIETIQRIWRWHGEFMIEGQFQTLLKRFWLLYWAGAPLH